MIGDQIRRKIFHRVLDGKNVSVIISAKPNLSLFLSYLELFRLTDNLIWIWCILHSSPDLPSPDLPFLSIYRAIASQLSPKIFVNFYQIF